MVSCLLLGPDQPVDNDSHKDSSNNKRYCRGDLLSTSYYGATSQLFQDKVWEREGKWNFPKCYC